MLESEQFMWTYYQLHSLGGGDSKSSKFRNRESSEIINKDSMEKGRLNTDKP